MPAGSVFGHKGSAVFSRQDSAVHHLFLLGYLNSSPATFLMKNIVNSTATADVGYIERLPFRRPDKATHDTVVAHVRTITDNLKPDAHTDITDERESIDDLIFGLFEITNSRETVGRFYRTVGLVEQDDSLDPSEAAALAR